MHDALVSRYGLVLVIFWIGGMKFTAYEANGIQPPVANSPFMGWLYGFLSVQTFSNLLGVVEIAIAVMIGLRWLAPQVSAIGSVLAMVMFLTTLECEADDHSVVLNLREVKLVNRDVVSFLATCETRGITLANCPAYIGEWIGKKHHRIKIK